jgi:RNA polymerase sigma-70 factor (ECF subfamily)
MSFLQIGLTTWIATRFDPQPLRTEIHEELFTISSRNPETNQAALSREQREPLIMDEQRLQTLVRNAQTGDKNAFGKLVEQFEPAVFGTVLRRLRNRSEARETTQDVFIQAMRKLTQLREPERLGSWLLRIAGRMAINRAVRGPRERLQSPETFNSLKSSPETPLDRLMQLEQAHQVRGGLGRLRDMDRRTLVAFYFEGQSLKEMSAVFERPIGTIKRRLHTARNRLRDELVKM